MGRSARYAFDAVKRNEYNQNSAFAAAGYRAHLPESSSATPNDATAEDQEILEPGAKPRGVMSQLPTPMSAADAAA